MSDPHVSESMALEGSPDEIRSALFAHLVVQQSSMALMLLGKTAHPETGKTVRDLDAAQYFIDQLEMLEFKTKGNLNPEEAGLLKQSLMAPRRPPRPGARAAPGGRPPASRRRPGARTGQARAGPLCPSRRGSGPQK